MDPQRPFALATLSLLVLAPLAMGPTAAATAPATPEDGFQWHLRTNHTHVVAQIENGRATVPIDKVPTPYVDVEVRAEPTTLFQVVGPTSYGVRILESYVDGTLVLWSLPSHPGTYTIQELGSTRTILVELAPLMPLAWCFWWCQEEPPAPPAPTGSDTVSGRAIQQAAFSYTPHGKVTTTSCSERRITIGVFASAGIAAGEATAGTEYSRSLRTCDTFSSEGTPVIQRGEFRFQRDAYEDGSYKIYSTGAVAVGSTGTEKFDLQAFGKGTRWETNVTFTREVTTKTEAAASFTAGVHAFGTGLSVSLAGSLNSEARIAITLTPPADNRTHVFEFGFLGGDGTTTGIVGYVYYVGPKEGKICRPC